MEKVVQKEEYIIRQAESLILSDACHCYMSPGLYIRVFSEGKVSWIAPNGSMVNPGGVSYLE